jgi:hypothetical protein
MKFSIMRFIFRIILVRNHCYIIAMPTDLEDKDDEAGDQISDLYKRQARKNGAVETAHAVETPTSTKLSPNRVG